MTLPDYIWTAEPELRENSCPPQIRLAKPVAVIDNGVAPSAR